MMPSQAASGAEAGMSGVRNAMAQHYPGMTTGGMLNGGASQPSAAQSSSNGAKNFNAEDLGAGQSTQISFSNLLMGGGQGMLGTQGTGAHQSAAQQFAPSLAAPGSQHLAGGGSGPGPAVGMRLSSDDLSFPLGGDVRGLASPTADDTSRTAGSSILNMPSLQGEEDMKRFDVLKYYDEHLSAGKPTSALASSLFLGGLDTGMEIGKFTIDTTNNINNNSSNFSNDPHQPSQE